MANSAIIIKKDGHAECTPDIGYLLSKLRNGEYTLTIKRRQIKRTISQNALLWMWLRCIESETGTGAEDCYTFYSRKFLRKVVSLGMESEDGYENPKSLDTARMSKFLEQVRQHALDYLGVRLPLPQDLYFDAFFAEYGEG